MSLAGLAAVAAGVALLVSGGCLVLFFATEVEAWGRANDATIALFAVLMIPPAFDIYERFATDARWLVGIPTFAGIAGMLVIATSSGLTAAGKLDWQLSAKIGAVGFGGLLIWMTATCLLILWQGGFPPALAWFGLFAVAVMGGAVILSIRFIRMHGSFSGDVQPGAGTWIVFAFAFLCFPVWTVWLGFSLVPAAS